MKPQERQSIVWATIERLAFRPSNRRDTSIWISLYNMTIDKLWDLPERYVPSGINTKFQVPFLNISCEYGFDGQAGNDYDVWIRFSEDEERCLWTVHVDPEFSSMAALHNEIRKYPRQDYDRNLRKDVEYVLSGMIFHPRNHSHLEDCGLISIELPENQALQLHEIRIGGGIENTFVFLFHLRYQFCLVSEEIRKQEKDRLISLFTSAIREQKQSITPSELFDFRREDTTCFI